MKLSNLLKEYSEYRADMKSLPNGSLTKKIIKQRMSDFLERVNNKYGQNIVDIITKDPRIKNKTQTEIIAILRESELI